MRRLTAITLAFVFLGLGSGAAQYLHELQHFWQDAAGRGCGPASDSGGSRPVHDESNCVIHAQLRVPIAPIASAPPLMPAGTLIVRLALADRATVAQTCPGRVDCRGPPSC